MASSRLHIPITGIYDILTYEYYTGTPFPSGTGAFSKSRLGVQLKDKNGKLIIIQ